MKKKVYLAALLIIALCLPASGGEGEPLVLEDNTILGINSAPLARAEITVNIEKNGNVVQIPQLVWDEGSREVGLNLNREIISYIGNYEAYLAGASGSC